MKTTTLLITLATSLGAMGTAQAGPARVGQFDIQSQVVGIALAEDSCMYTSEITFTGHIENHLVRGRGHSTSKSLCNNEVLEDTFIGAADVLVKVTKGKSPYREGYRFKGIATAFSQPLTSQTTGMILDTSDFQMDGSLIAIEEEAADCLFLTGCDGPQEPTKPIPTKPNPKPRPKPQPEEDCVAVPVLGIEEEAADC